MAHEFTDGSFKNEALDAKGLVLVDFWAPWCGPCKMQGPIIEDLAKQFDGKAGVTIGKLNVDDNVQTAQAYQIMSIPTLLLFKDGKVVEQMIGLQSKEVLMNKINSHLS